MAPASRLAETAEPDPYFDGFTAAIIGRAITTAVASGVIDSLAERPAAGAELADRLDLDRLGSDALLTALLALGHLSLEGDRYRLTAVAERHLVRSSPESIATFVGEQGDLHREILNMVPGAVRTGRPYAMHEERRDPARWDAYVGGLFEASRGEHDGNAALVPIEGPRRLLDVAGAHGAFAMATCRRHVSRHGALSSLLFYPWSHGPNFTRDEIATWLEEAGFADVRVHRNERSPWRIVVVGRAPR